MGGGRRNFMTNNSKDPEEDEVYGRRNDGRDLIAEWKSLRPNKDRSRYVWNQTEFNKVDVNKIDYLLGKYTYNTHVPISIVSSQEISLLSSTSFVRPQGLG